MTCLIPAALATLFCRRQDKSVSAELLRARPPAAADVGGPGWFDSSWDLQSGLEVREGWADEARLREWIDVFCLRAQASLGEVAA